MKKSVLFLLALSGCVRLNYVDIPAQENSYKFRYVGENALVECVDEKLADRMCEKDGITPANGIWAQEISGKKYNTFLLFVLQNNSIIYNTKIRFNIVKIQGLGTMKISNKTSVIQLIIIDNLNLFSDISIHNLYREYSIKILAIKITNKIPYCPKTSCEI